MTRKWDIIKSSQLLNGEDSDLVGSHSSGLKHFLPNLKIFFCGTLNCVFGKWFKNWSSILRCTIFYHPLRCSYWWFILRTEILLGYHLQATHGYLGHLWNILRKKLSNFNNSHFYFTHCWVQGRFSSLVSPHFLCKFASESGSTIDNQFFRYHW